MRSTLMIDAGRHDTIIDLYQRVVPARHSRGSCYWLEYYYGLEYYVLSKMFGFQVDQQQCVTEVLDKIHLMRRAEKY